MMTVSIPNWARCCLSPPTLTTKPCSSDQPSHGCAASDILCTSSASQQAISKVRGTVTATAANRSARFTRILGLGGVRRAEMAVACKVMGVECTVVNDPSLQDGPNEVWSLQLLSRHIGTGIARTGADTLVTFDDRGVSGHPNHIAVGAGAELAVVESGGGVKVLYLETTTLLRKFSGPLDVLLSTWLCGRMCVTDIDGMRRTYAAMRSHASQWVWYRKLFVPFSRYTYVNTFRATRQGTT
eukprot:m.47442 g.47442  ORF g.47442 m.47442 type:complete len:241 (-) comp8864_c0_seq1:1833-2555(-)